MFDAFIALVFIVLLLMIIMFVFVLDEMVLHSTFQKKIRKLLRIE